MSNNVIYFHSFTQKEVKTLILQHLDAHQTYTKQNPKNIDRLKREVSQLDPCLTTWPIHHDDRLYRKYHCSDDMKEDGQRWLLLGVYSTVGLFLRQINW